MEHPQAARTLQLPLGVVSRIDVGRLVREAEELDNILRQAAIRQPGTPVQLPRTSHLLEEFMGLNQLNALHEGDREKMAKYLTAIKAKAPVLHMSFAADPSPSFLQKLMSYLRQNIHPLVLVQVGLQPNLGAGCMLRTTNKVFDLSLRQFFKKQYPLLIQQIHGQPVAEKPAEPAPAPTTAPAPQPVEQPAPAAPAPQEAPTT